MSELTAIDVLFNPDDHTIGRAKAVNARLRESVPTGYALDASHRPHITTLQRYVRTAELGQVLEAVEKTIHGMDIFSLGFEAVLIRHSDWDTPGQGYAAYVVKPSPEVFDFQSSLLENLAPYVGSGGTAAAFVTDADDPEINAATLEWVEHFVPDQIGPKYTPHLSLGFAMLDDLKVIEAEPFDAFPIYPTGTAVYKLGNNGNARKELRSWNL